MKREHNMHPTIATSYAWRIYRYLYFSGTDNTWTTSKSFLRSKRKCPKRPDGRRECWLIIPDTKEKVYSVSSPCVSLTLFGMVTYFVRFLLLLHFAVESQSTCSLLSCMCSLQCHCKLMQVNSSQCRISCIDCACHSCSIQFFNSHMQVKPESSRVRSSQVKPSHVKSSQLN